ncbi:hypothetical protein I3843_08G152800 [Carya illinoinensis]|nr:hypothetical protein I3843_08G152800 [Carya illinoinensis]
MEVGRNNTWNDVFEWVKPAILMVVAQLLVAGGNIFYKLAAYDGMSLRVIVAYRFSFAAAFVVPIALLVERKSRPKLTWAVLFQSFLTGLFGQSLYHNLFIESLALTSATFASAMTNIIPAIAFMLAVSFGLERLGLGTTAGKAKVLGTLMGIGGAMLLTFYKGPEINIWLTNVNLLRHDSSQHQSRGHDSTTLEPENRLLGCILALGSCLSYATWLIIQGIFGSGIMAILMIWCLRMRGPLYTSSFNPLMPVSVAIMGSLLLDEKFHLGSIIGAVMIVCGLYSVLWGKYKEIIMKKKKVVSTTSNHHHDQINISPEN